MDKKAPALLKCVPRAPTVTTHRLKLDMMDISSGSEFELEDDMEAADEDVDEEEEECQAWAEFVAARVARAQLAAQNKTLPRPPTARERVERPVWKKNHPNVDAGPSTSSLLPSSTAPSVPVGPVFGTTPVLTSAPTNQAQFYDEDNEDEEAENTFGPDNDVIGGLIIDPTAPAPIPQPIPPIIVPLLPPLLTPAIHVPAAPPLQVAPPQPTIPDVLPPQGYTIVPNATGGAPQLNPQHIHVICTIRAAIPLLELYLATELTFPDSFVASQFITTILVTSAANLGLTGLVDFLRVMVTLTKQRISTFRSTVKKNADAHIMAYYRLGPDPQKTQEKVNSLFDSLKCVYPITEKDTQLSALWKKPYSHECIAAVLRAAFAMGPNSLISQHPEILLSMNPKHPNECEILIVMLALVGTVKLRTHKPASFTADTYVNVYKEHMTLLQAIKKGSLNSYHKLMHMLYGRATGTTAPAAAAAAPRTALAHVDIQGMDVDSD
ncbi:hypothetical protein LXA43DRAFT_1092748 [Ganoderma leucocontextum]|nr:hypothetical protein LXA43DRAFT_1092748 [Ganoderma leucocontextum]